MPSIRLSSPARAEQAEAVQPGHHHVGQDQAGWLPLNRGQGGQTVRHGFDRVLIGQEPRDVTPHVRVVVRNQHAGTIAVLLGSAGPGEGNDVPVCRHIG
jgi:hypothetical protein